MSTAAGAAAMLGAAPAYADKIDDAAKKLSEASYPFLKEIDWTSDVYGKLPTQSPAEVMKTIDSMLKLGAAMDPAALKTGVNAHSKAFSSMDGKLVTSLADYTAVNSALRCGTVLACGKPECTVGPSGRTFQGFIKGCTAQAGCLPNCSIIVPIYNCHRKRKK